MEGTAPTYLTSDVYRSLTLWLAELVLNVSYIVTISHLRSVFPFVNALVFHFANLAVELDSFVCSLHQVVLLCWVIKQE